MNREEINRWLKSFTGDTNNAIAERIGRESGNFSRLLTRNGLTANLVLEIADAYGKDPVEALKSASIIPTDAGDTIEARLELAIETLKSIKEEIVNTKVEQAFDNVAHLLYNDRAVADSSTEEREGNIDNYIP